MKLTHNTKVKLLQGLAHIGAPVVLLFSWNLEYFLYSILASWLILHVGVSVGLHRCFTHRSFIPKNKFILTSLHILSIINVLGSTIAWCGVHRSHHVHSDTEKDPHSPINISTFSRIKVFFNYWDEPYISPKMVMDLLKDPQHVFFHRNYFKILVSYMLMLAIIDIQLFLYGYLVVTALSLYWVSWITVGAHLIGTELPNSRDRSKNTYIMGLLMWGEGWHANHHSNPSSASFGWDGQPDIGKRLIDIIAKPSSIK